MKPLIDVLQWRDGAKAFSVTSEGEKIVVEFTHNGDDGNLSFWVFYDDNKQERTIDDVYLSFIDYDPEDTSQARLVQDFAENMEYRFDLDIDAPIWEEYL